LSLKIKIKCNAKETKLPPPVQVLSALIQSQAEILVGFPPHYNIPFSEYTALQLAPLLGRHVADARIWILRVADLEGLSIIADDDRITVRTLTYWRAAEA
jgi:hypothetical protein